MAIMAVHVIEHLQAAPSEAGLAVGIFCGGPGLTDLVRTIHGAGGRKKMLYSGLVVYSLATLCYAGTANLSLLFLIRCGHRVGFGMATTASLTSVASLIPPSRRGEGMRYFMLSVTVASAIGPFLGISLYHHAGFSTILWGCIILLGVTYVAVFFLKVVEAELTDEQPAHMKRFTIQNFFEMNVLPIATMCLYYVLHGKRVKHRDTHI